MLTKKKLTTKNSIKNIWHEKISGKKFKDKKKFDKKKNWKKMFDNKK